MKRMVYHLRTLWNEVHSERGITLIEILASIAILSLIIMTFLPMFTQSMRSTKVSSDTMDATYIAQSTMEEVYNVSMSHPFKDASEQLSEMTFIGIENDKNLLAQYKDGAYIELSLGKPFNGLSNVIVRVYTDETKSELKAQMETIYRWE